MYILLNIKKDNGQIFIILFWIIIVLVGIILGLSYRASHETNMVTNTWERSKAYFTTWTGIREVMEILNQDDPTVDHWGEEWSVGVKKGETEVGKWQVAIIYDEERFIDISGYTKYPVPNSVLKRIFYYLDPVLYYSLLDWRDADHIPRTDPSTGKIMGAEDDYYLPFGYESRDGPLKNLFELVMIKKKVKLFGKATSGNAFPLSIDIDRISSTQDKFNNLDSILSGLGISQDLAYASGTPSNPPPGVGPPTNVPPPPPPPPKPPKEWPPFDPGPPPAPVGPGRSVTVYGDGRLNINTAYPPALLAMGLSLETVKRITWYKLSGNVFPKGDAQTIISELVRTNWLFPRKGDRPPEKAYHKIVNNIRKIAPRLKVNSSYFFVYLVSDTEKASHLAMAVIKRELGRGGKSRCKIVSWWEWTN